MGAELGVELVAAGLANRLELAGAVVVGAEVAGADAGVDVEAEDVPPGLVKLKPPPEIEGEGLEVGLENRL